ncbi:hypothetical protein GCM10011328_33310 [Hafnia psychrotolerans]|uniref:Uncharacterized protein n=1 Tax=Hafnia psychrotolerans TaxID=1477018 RepID=A0ABQ1H176_9GAMM|nr:hypothetical protein GCM10011328_33310 [Hafnia psychrotolerans]
MPCSQSSVVGHRYRREKEEIVKKNRVDWPEINKQAVMTDCLFISFIKFYFYRFNYFTFLEQ